MSKKVTMQQIADQLGLSKFSVSQALSGKPGISEGTRQLILQTAKTLGYRAANKSNAESIAAAAEARDEREVKPFILVWVKSTRLKEPSFWEKVLLGIMNGCAEFGWEHLIVPVQEESKMEISIPPYINRASCVGGIVLGTYPAQTILPIKHSGLPLVLVDHADPLADLDCVVNANIEASKMVCQRLIALGCSSFVFVGNDTFAVSFRERWWGCRMAVDELGGKTGAITLKKWGLNYRNEEIITEYLERKLDQTPQGELPDGFICANDRIALELIACLKKRDIAVPGRCRVVGFDNIESAAYATPALTTVHLGKEELGYRAVETLDRRVRRPGSPSETIVLNARLVIRDSG